MPNNYDHNDGRVLPDGAVLIEDAAVASEQQLDVAQMLGKDLHEWTAADGSHSVAFGRARGLASVLVAKVLGPSQAHNIVLSMFLMAILSIREFDGKPLRQPENVADFERVMESFGTEDTADANFNDYVMAWQKAMHPEMFAEMQSAYDRNDLPDSFERIAREAGKATAKKSPRARTRTRS